MVNHKPQAIGLVNSYIIKEREMKAIDEPISGFIDGLILSINNSRLIESLAICKLFYYQFRVAMVMKNKNEVFFFKKKMSFLYKIIVKYKFKKIYNDDIFQLFFLSFNLGL